MDALPARWCRCCGSHEPPDPRFPEECSVCCQPFTWPARDRARESFGSERPPAPTTEAR